MLEVLERGTAPIRVLATATFHLRSPIKSVAVHRISSRTASHWVLRRGGRRRGGDGASGCRSRDGRVVVFGCLVRLSLEDEGIVGAGLRVGSVGDAECTE